MSHPETKWNKSYRGRGSVVDVGSRTNTKYMPTPLQEENIKLADGPRGNVFKYLGSMFAAEGGSETDVNTRVEAAWANWRTMSGVMCDKKMPIQIKDKIYKTTVKPEMTQGFECWAIKKKDPKNKLHNTDMRMMRWARTRQGRTTSRMKTSGGKPTVNQ